MSVRRRLPRPCHALGLPRFLRIGRGRIGMAILLVPVVVALLGPFFAPHSPSALVGPPGVPPGGEFLLGTDYLGHDVLSRVLWGGRSVLWLSLASTLLAYAIGVTTGVIAGYNRNLLDPLLMRAVDVILVFPPLLFFIIAATAAGTSEATLVIGVAIVLAPGVARIVYTATRETAVRGFVEAAVVRGETTRSILAREILPTISPVLIANVGLSFTFAILLVAAVNFLGLGLQPPAANWALMISENRPVQSLNIWATLSPVAMIAMLTVGVNLLGDAISQSSGRSGFAIEPLTVNEVIGSAAGERTSG